MARTFALRILPVLAVAALLAGCGGGKKAQTGGTGSSSSVAAMGATPAETKAAIRQNWEAFFDGSTAAAKRVSLLQNGSAFASLLDQLNGSSLAKQVKATVSSVKIDGPSSGTVTYTVFLGKQPVLPNAKGKAVLVDGTWKVGVASFCGLLALEGVTHPACSSAGK